MSSLSFRSTKPDGWTMPRPYNDPNMRRAKHGPIQPMHAPSFLERLFGR
ncbi:hypothetical protein ACXYN8_09265 [Altererythrobacter sp. CAU 1778]